MFSAVKVPLIENGYCVIRLPELPETARTILSLLRNRCRNRVTCTVVPLVLSFFDSSLSTTTAAATAAAATSATATPTFIITAAREGLQYLCEEAEQLQIAAMHDAYVWFVNVCHGLYGA